MKKQQNQMRRWYDAFENMRIITSIMEVLPSLHRSHIAQKMHQVITQHLGMLIDKGISLQLDTDVVLNLYKSKRKKRWYDGIYPLHSALNRMMGLPEIERAIVAHKCEAVREEACRVATKLGFDLTEVLHPTDVIVLRQLRTPKSGMVEAFPIEGTILHQRFVLKQEIRD
jgi:hypothetical protein